MNHYAESHIGQRENNEDSYLIDEELGLFIVADGVGGLDKGEIASQITCEEIQKQIKNGTSLVDSIQRAHKKILEELQVNPQKQGMASTVVAVLFKDNAYELAWVGDSRVYLWDGELKQITRDHSYVELLLENGHIKFEDMSTHPDKNIISQALGIEKDLLDVATNKGSLEKNQILLLATDGLYEIFKEKIMIQSLKNSSNIENFTKEAVKSAVSLDGKDNITLLTIQSNVNSSQNSRIKAKVIRKFDTETGKAKEVSKQLVVEEEATVQIEKLKIKAIVPKKLTTESKAIKEVKPSIIELSFFIVAPLLILILITFML
jgi:protein phosphatase